MRTRSDHTRDRLIEAGERLFADRGVDHVTVAEITKAAGQRNGAAVHYHFGGRGALLDAIVDRHHTRLDAQRLDRLEALRGRADVEVRDLVAIIVEPMVDCLATESGRAFLKIQAQRSALAGGILAQPSPAMRRVRHELDRVLPDLPADLRAERGRLTGLMVSQRLGRRADEESRGHRRPARRVVAEVLIDAVTAVLTAPIAGDEPRGERPTNQARSA